MEYIRSGVLTKKELDLITKEKNNYASKAVKGGITNGDQNRYDLLTRDCKIYFTKPLESPKTYNILQSLAIDACSNMNLPFSNIGSIQYVIYEVGGRFNWHKDSIIPRTIKSENEVRYFTMSINLSNEEEYGGGELQVKHDKKIFTLNKEPGSFIIFPAFLQHRVTEVTLGVREAIVLWVQAPYSDLVKLQEKYYASYGR